MSHLTITGDNFPHHISVLESITYQPDIIFSIEGAIRDVSYSTLYVCSECFGQIDHPKCATKCPHCMDQFLVPKLHMVVGLLVSDNTGLSWLFLQGALADLFVFPYFMDGELKYGEKQITLKKMKKCFCHKKLRLRFKFDPAWDKKITYVSPFLSLE